MARLKQSATANVAFLAGASATQQDGQTPKERQTQQAHNNQVASSSSLQSTRQKLKRKLITVVNGTKVDASKGASDDHSQLFAYAPQQQQRQSANVEFLSSLPSRDATMSNAMASTAMSFDIYRGHSSPPYNGEERHKLSAKNEHDESPSTHPPANDDWADSPSSTMPQPQYPSSNRRTVQLEYSNVTWLSGVRRGWEQQEVVANAEFLSGNRTPLTESVVWPFRSRDPIKYSYIQETGANTTFLHQNSVFDFNSAARPVICPPLGETSISVLTYPPLNEGSTGSLRLLRIDDVVDSNLSNDVYCTLVAAQPWNTGVHYECLSYCWGSSTSKGRLFVKTNAQSTPNYKQIAVSMNLCSALQRLRLTHTMKWLWIDAICIDQSNPTELASQVAIMKEIYSNASGVVIWLGNSDDAISASVSTISAISERFQADTGRMPASIVGRDGLGLSRVDIEHLRSYVSPETLNTTLGQAYKLLAHFFALPWFRRVWVLQEAFAQNNIRVRLGEHTLPWGSVIIAALWASGFTRKYTAMSASKHQAESATGRGHLPELWLGLLHTRVERGLSILELVARARDFKASDSRDKLFALLGLANDLGNPKDRAAGFRPDYTKTTSEVYAAFAHDLILTTGDLDVLSLVNTFPFRALQNAGLVSWMPNLDTPIATIRGLGFPKKYNASFGTKAKIDIIRQQNTIPTVLDLTGFCIDVVDVVLGNVMMISRDLKVYINGNTEAVTELWKAYVRPNHPHASEADLLQSYIELLTAAGFAMPTDFPAYPLGRIVPSREVPSLVADFAAYWSSVEADFSSFSDSSRLHLKQLAEVGDAEQFGVLVGKACHERKFFLTAGGRMGLCPRDTQKGDPVVILYGASAPYVLRTIKDGDHTFVGECYVDGIMFGETEKMQRPDQIFHLR